MNHTFYGCASITNSQRTQFRNKQIIPGPGTYDPNQEDNKKIPAWTLKPKIQYTSCFYDHNSFMPPPGTYQIPTALVRSYFMKNVAKKDKDSRVKVSKDKGKSYGQRNSPVLQLHLPSFVEQKNGFSFGYRSQVIVQQTSPGPKYHINQKLQESRNKKIMNKSTGFGFGCKIKLQNDNLSPGPGNYSPQKMNLTSGNWTFSKSSRKKNNNKYQNPLGPGQYNIQLQKSVRTCKFKGKYSPIKADDYSACPGSYQIPDTKSKRCAVFTEKVNNQLKQNSNSQMPSPFTYDPQNSTLKKGGFSLGKKIESRDLNIDNPGPGSYEIQSKITDKIGGYVSRKLQQKKKVSQNQDNFYKYNPQNDAVNYKYPQYTFSQSSNNKLSSSNNENIGPGSFNVSMKNSGESYSIGRDPRFKPLVKQKGFTNTIINKNMYSACGFLPSYLKSTRNKKQNTVQTNRSSYNKQSGRMSQI